MEHHEDSKRRLIPSRAERETRAVNAAPRFYSVAQVARIFGMSTMTVYRAIAAGEFPAVKVRGRLIVPAKAVEEMCEAAMAERSVVDASGWVAGSAVAR